MAEELKLAEKAMKSSLFHKPEPEDAVVHYQNAGTYFTTQQSFAMALSAFENAATAAYSINMNLPAAVNYYNAATAARRAGNPDKVVECLKAAIPQFQLAGKFVQAANLLIELDTEQHEDGLVDRAVELFVQENKPAYASMYLFEGAERLVEAGKLQQAVKMYDAARNIYKKTTLLHKIDQISLICVILALYIGDTVSADQEYDKFNNYNSDEADMADKLYYAYKSADEESFEQVKKSHDGKLGLSNIVLKLLSGIKCPDAANDEEMI